MIITRAPLRISFAGGGSDLPAFYRDDAGAVLSATITAYMHVMVTHKFDGAVRLGYSRTENVAWVRELQHDLAREALKYCGIERAVEVVSLADVPAGTGLGSSSAYAVALLQALYAFHEWETEPEILARNACVIEIEKCGHPIGKQDQYASAYGGLRLYEFAPEGVQVGPALEMAGLENHLMLFYTGQTRDANGVLARQKLDRGALREMADLARVLAALTQTGTVPDFARAMEVAWGLKRRLAPVDDGIDELLQMARRQGALAGKLCGAGQSGFLLLVVPPECQDAVRGALNVRPRRELRFKFEPQGSQVIYATNTTTIAQ